MSIHCITLRKEEINEVLKIFNSDTFKPLRNNRNLDAEKVFLNYVKSWLNEYYPETENTIVDYKLPTEEQLLNYLVKVVKIDFLEKIVNPEKIDYYNIWFSNYEHSELSNFTYRPFTYEAPNNKQYKVKSVEQAFQLAKALNSEGPTIDDVEDILNAETSYKAKIYGGRMIMTPEDKANWDKIKVDIMKDIIRQSLIQHPETLRTLLSINKPITHFDANNESPRFWGIKFPKILEELKEEFKSDEYVNVNNFMNVRSNKVIVRPFKQPQQNDSSKANDTMRIYLKNKPDIGYFEVVMDAEDGRYYVYFKPKDKDNSNAWSEEEKEILFQAVADMIPSGAYLSVRGELSKGGVAGLNRFGNLGFTEVERRDIKIKGNKSPITKVISGGQTGVDTIGLQVAKKLGIETGGKAPRGFLREEGIDTEDIASYGLVEITSEEQADYTKRTGKRDPYTGRTELNVRNSDGTVYFSTSDDKAGLVATRRSAAGWNKPFLENPTAEELADWIVKNNIKVLNVAGNRGSKLSKNNEVADILEEALSGVKSSGITIPVWQKNDDISSIITESEKFYNRTDVMDDPDYLYIFTDNTDRTSGGEEIDDGWYAKKYGKGGYGTVKNPTSAVIRGLPNAAPISTMKWFYKVHEGETIESSRWTDDDFEEFKIVIDDEIEDIKKLWREGNFKGIKLPKGGVMTKIGVGADKRIAQLNIRRVPRLYEYLSRKMAELADYVNDSSTVEKFENNLGIINEENWHKVDAVFTSSKKRKRITLINKLFSKEVENAKNDLIAELENQLSSATNTRTKLALAKAINNMTPFVAIKQSQPITLYSRVKDIFINYINAAKDSDSFEELVKVELENSVGTFMDKFPDNIKRKVAENKVKYYIKEYQLMVDNWDELIQDAASIYGDTYSIYIDLSKNLVFEEFEEENTDTEGYNREEEKEDNAEETPYKEGWMQDVRELSVSESMTNRVRASIDDIERTDRNGNIIVDDLGYAQTLQASYVFTEILSALKNMTTASEMLPMLERLQARKPWASQIVNALKNDDQLFTAYYRVFRKDYLNMWVQRVNTLPDGSIQVKTVNINKPSGTSHYFDEWRDNFEYGLVLDKEDSIYNENGEIRKDKAEVGVKLVNSIREQLRGAKNKDLSQGKRDSQKIILESTETIHKLLSMLGVAITPESLNELLGYNVDYNKRDLLPGQIILNQLSIIFKDILRNEAIKDGEPADLLNLYGNAFNKIAMAINNIDEDEVESSTRQGKKTLYSHIRPSYLTTLIKKLKGPNSEDFIDKEYKVDFLYDRESDLWYNTLIADLKNDLNAREKLEHMVLLEYNRKNYNKWTPLDTFLALFSQYNAEPMEASSKEGYAWYQVPLLSDAESAEFIRAKRVRTNYREVLSKKFVNVIRQEYNRIVTVRQRYNNNSVEKIAGYDMADDYLGGAKFHFFPELNTEAYSKDGKSFFERLAEVADDIDAFEKLAKDAIEQIMDNNFVKAIDNWASIGVFDRVNPNDSNSAFKYFMQRSKERIKNILEEYYWNSTYMQSQIIQLLTTDLAYYGTYANFTKRALEFHSPTEKLNTLAKWDGKYVLADKNGNVRPARAIALMDELKPSKWLKEVEEVIDSKIAEGKLTQYDKTVILSIWKKVNVTDAQAMRTFKSFRATQIAGDMWGDDYEKAYNNIRSGNWTAKDFVVLWNTRKPYLYTQYNHSDGVGGTMRSPVQHKNSEILMLTQAAFGAILHQSSKFKALSDFMEEHDIDVAMFGSAIKVGGKGFVNLNGDLSAEDTKKILEDRYLVNGEINTNTVQEYNWEDYGFQVATPEHNINAIQLFGTQIRRLICTDLDPNARFRVGGMELTKEQWLNYFNAINTANIREAFEKLDSIYKDPKKISELLIKEIKKNSRYSNDLIEAVTFKNGKFNIPIFDLTTSQKLQELLNSVVKSRIVKQKIKGGALIQASPWLLNEKDKPKIIWGTDKNGKKYIKYMEAYIACPDDSLYDLLLEPDGSININKKDSKGNYIVPEKYRRAIGYRIPTEYKYSMIPIRVKGFLPRQVGSVIILPEEITATTGSDYDVDKIYMMYHSIRVRDTYNLKRAWDDFYKSHPEIVEKIEYSKEQNFVRSLKELLEENPDLDIDVDELREAFIEQNKRKYKEYEWDSSVQKEFSKWFETTKDKYTLNQRKVEVIEYKHNDITPDSGISEIYKQAKTNTKAQRDNMLIDLMFSTLTNYSTVDQIINPGGFEEPKRNARICTLLRNLTLANIDELGGIEKILNLTINEADKLLTSYGKVYNPLTPDTWINFQQRNMSGASLVPMAATQNASHAIAQFTKDFRVGDKYVYKFNGEYLGKLTRVNDVTGHYITKNVGSYLAAFVDNAKDAIAGDLNINTITANLLFLLIRLGHKPITASLVLSQPAVDMILKYINTGNYTLKEAIEQSIQDCKDRRSSANTGVTKNHDFTDVWLAKNIAAAQNAGDIHSSYIEEAEFYNNQMTVLVMLKDMFKAAEGLGDIVRAVRFDAQTGSSGGSIAKGLAKINAISDILDNQDFPLEGLDFLWDFTKQPSEEVIINSNLPIQVAFYKWGLEKTLDWYKDLFPQVGNFYQNTIGQLKRFTTYGKINEDTTNKVFNHLTLFLMTLVSKDFVGDKDSRDYYLNKFPEEFTKFKAKERYLVAQLPILKRIQYRGSNKYNGSSVLIFNNVGKVTNIQANDYRSDLRYLVLNDSTKDIALKLLKYNFYRGLAFSPLGFSNFIPSLLKMDIGTDYVQSLERVLRVQSDDSLIDRFIDQYIRNNLNDRTFVPEVSYSGLFKEGSELPESFKVTVTKASSSDMKRFIYRDQDDIKYRDYICYTYKGLPRYYRHTGQGNYELITPLGDIYYKEYDANSSIMESTIKEVKKKSFKSVMVQQIEQQFEGALAGLDNTFADIYDNSQIDEPSNSNDTSDIEGQLSTLDGIISSLNAPQSQVSTSSGTSSSLDTLSPEEEAHFDRGIDFEALYKELQNIDPSETDLDNNKNCANIK